MIIKDLNENDTTLALKDNDINQFRWGMREALARKNASNIWGNSFLFQSKENNVNKTFNRLSKLNNLQNLFTFIEKELSKYGRAIITLNKSKTGDVLLNVVPPIMFSGVGKAF